VLVGPPGVGKTALARHWAHRVGDRYADGQLYADLGGPGGAVPVEQVFGRFLAALGVAAQRIPVELAAQAALYRELTTDLRLLVLLDNAASAADIRALLPASSASLTVVTGQSLLGSLIADGARFVELEPLSQRHGVELLARTVGAARIAAEDSHTHELVRLCGGLPIALSVTGARLATRPKWTVEKVVTDLLDERRRLARLSFGDDLSVQAVFDVSYQALSAPAARLYRLMGLHPGPDFGAGVAAAVLGSPLLEAETLLDELLNANLVDEPQAGRCRFHDLIRLHARKQADDEESAENRNLAMRRMLDWYLHSATVAGRSITPHRTNLRRDIEYEPVSPISFPGHAEALDWLDDERINLLAAARAARDEGLPSLAWQLADAMWGLFLYRTHYHDWLQFDLLAEQAARSCADPAMEAETQDRLGLLFHALGRNDEALEHMTRAEELWQQLDNRPRMASSLERFGFVYLDQGNVDLAIDRFTRALAEYRTAGENRNTGLALISLGRALTTAGRPADATGFLAQAADVLGSLPVPDPYNSARALIFLGRAETKIGQPDRALERLKSALATMRSVNSPLGEADALWSLAELHEQSGRPDDARVCYERTALLLTQLGNPGAPRVLERLRTLGPNSPAD
jgi:tetratricopeptide (TPR) repeat protein